MSQKPNTLDHVWGERDLCAKLGLPVNDKTGNSIQIGNMINGGLKCAIKSGRRYFFEQDVIDYLWSRREKSETPTTETNENEA